METISRYDAVLFDLDGTLYDRDAVVLGIAQEQFRAFRDSLSGISESTFVETLLRFDNHGHGDKQEGYREAIEAWSLDPELSGRLFEHFWGAYDSFCTLPDDALVTLRALREHKVKLGVITNGGAVRQRRKLEALGIGDFFDVILISEEERVRKPDPEIFRRAIHRCEVNPGRTLFVGDHPEVDVAGAVAAGLDAAWKYVPYWNPVLHHVPTIERLSEILPLCLGSHAAVTS